MKNKKPTWFKKSEWSLKTPLFVKPLDKRYKRHKQQLESRGFSDSETWCLDSVIAKFILPRLVRFKEVNIGFPGDLNEKLWNEILDKMIFAFEWVTTYDDVILDTNVSKEKEEENWKKYDEGMSLFTKYFRDLWW